MGVTSLIVGYRLDMSIHHSIPRTRKISPAAWLGALAICAAFPSGLALACTPSPGWPTKIRLDPARVAQQMAASAAYIDLVRVEALTDDYEVGTRTPDGWAAWIGSGPEAPKTIEEALKMARAEWDDGVRIHYRVVEHLKGDGGDAFVMDGEQPRAWVKGSSASKISDLKFYLQQQDLAAWPGPGSCLREVTAFQGALYLVFRDADRRLLQAPVSITFQGKALSVSGPANVPVRGSADPWVSLVRDAVAGSVKPSS